MANKGVFNAELMASTKVGSLLRSAKQATDIENGSIVRLDGLLDGEMHLYEAKPLTDIEQQVWFVDGVPLVYDEQVTMGKDDFVNEAGKAFRVRKPMVNDIFSISASMIDAIATAPVVGNVVESAVGNKVAEATTATATASFVAEIEAVYSWGIRDIKMARLVVVKA